MRGRLESLFARCFVVLTAALTSVSFAAGSETADAAPAGERSPDLVTGATARTEVAPNQLPRGLGAEANPGARRDLRTLSPDPSKLRRAAVPSAGGGRTAQAVSPLPKASLFGGLNQAGMAAEGNLTPPDATGAIGPNHYVQFVNGTGIAVYDRSLDPVAGPVPLEEFIGFPEDAVFDPQIQWDENWGRWLYVMADVEFFENEAEEIETSNWIAFGWSKTADPSDLTTEFPGEGAGAGWCGYFLFTGEEFDDYPKLGHSDTGITFGTNVFGPSGFLTSRIWSIAKPPSPGSCPELGFGSVGAIGSEAEPLETADGDIAFTPVPANTADSSSASYVAAADSPYFTADAEIMAWHVSGAGEGATLVADGNMAVSPFEFPEFVPQPGTDEVLDSLDARLTNAVAVTDPAVGRKAVWTQHTVDGPGGRSVARWYELLPETLTVRQEGSVSDPSHSIFNAAISPTAEGDAAAIHFNRASATLFPEMHARSREASTPLGTMADDVLLGISSGPAADFSCDIDFGEPCRWGDYAGASPDHSAPGVVWGSNQGLASPSGDDARWTTRNFALRAAPAPPDPPAPPPEPEPEPEPEPVPAPVPGASAPPPPVPPLPRPRRARPTALAGFLVQVRGGKAMVALRCQAAAACRGSLRLVARIGSRKRTGATRSRRRTRNVVVGRGSFALPPGGARKIRIALNRRGKALVRRAGRRGVRVRLVGGGVRARSVKLRNAGNRRASGKRQARRQRTGGASG